MFKFRSLIQTFLRSIAWTILTLAFLVSFFSLAAIAGSVKRDYYETLQVPKTATQDEIKKSYRKLAMGCHPDRFPNDKAKEEEFKELSEAYEVIGDEENRKTYDRAGSQTGSSQSDRAGNSRSKNPLYPILELLNGKVSEHTILSHIDDLVPFIEGNGAEVIRQALKTWGSGVVYHLKELKDFTSLEMSEVLIAAAKARGSSVQHDFKDLLQFKGKPDAIRALKAAARARGSSVHHDYKDLEAFEGHPGAVEALEHVAPIRWTSLHQDYADFYQFESKPFARKALLKVNRYQIKNGFEEVAALLAAAGHVSIESILNPENIHYRYSDFFEIDTQEELDAFTEAYSKTEKLSSSLRTAEGAEIRRLTDDFLARFRETKNLEDFETAFPPGILSNSKRMKAAFLNLMKTPGTTDRLTTLFKDSREVFIFRSHYSLPIELDFTVARLSVVSKGPEASLQDYISALLLPEGAENVRGSEGYEIHAKDLALEFAKSTRSNSDWISLIEITQGEQVKETLLGVALSSRTSVPDYLDLAEHFRAHVKSLRTAIRNSMAQFRSHDPSSKVTQTLIRVPEIQAEFGAQFVREWIDESTSIQDLEALRGDPLVSKIGETNPEVRKAYWRKRRELGVSFFKNCVDQLRKW